MVKKLSVAPGWLWYDSVDPGLSETNVSQFNWWLNTSTNDKFICLNPTGGAQVWQKQVGNGTSPSFVNLAFTGGLFTSYTNPGAYPYTTLGSDYIILVDTSLARTITLIASPTNGQQIIIKDNVGSASTNNITVSGNAKNIDGAASFTMNVNYQSVALMYQGTEWRVL